MSLMENPGVSNSFPFPGDSAAHALLREHDWSRSPLGPPQDWAPALKTAVRMALSSGFPMFVAWGRELRMIYNAAYAEILGGRHPQAFGQPLRAIWGDADGVLDTLLDLAAAGSGLYCENTPLMVAREGHEDRLWLSFSLSPLQDDAGTDAGFYGICTETTGQVLAQRRQSLLLELADALRELSEPERICSVAARLLGRYLEVSQVLFGRGAWPSAPLDWFAGYCAGGEPADAGWRDIRFGLPDVDAASGGRTSRLVAEDLTRAPFAASAARGGWEAHAVRAAVAVPVPLDGGQAPLCLLVAQEWPRRWSNAEVALIEEIALRVEGALKLAGAEQALRHVDDAVRARLVSERDTLRQLFSHSPDFAAVLHGPRHVFEMANHSYRQLVGGRELIGRPFDEALPELCEQGYSALLDQVFASREAFVGREMRALLRRPQVEAPEPAYLDFVLQPMLDAQGAVLGIFMQGYEVTAHRQARDETRIANERWKLAIDSTGDGVWDWSVRANQMVYSSRFKEIFGYADDQFPDTCEAWENRLHPDDRQEMTRRARACLRGEDTAFHAEYRILCRDGSWKWVESHGIVVARDDDGRPTRATGTLTDISAKKQTEAQYWSHANFDTLTGLPNRRLFRDRLDESVKKAERSGLGLALFFIDLDRFKEANDLLGHDAGDLLLIEAGRRIAAAVRAADTVARLGGDEFTVILEEQSEEAHVERTAQKIIEALAQPFHIGSEIVYLSASVGITLYSTDANASEELIKNADQAMYAAKNAGRNRFSYFTRAMQEAADQRFRLGGDLRQALDEGRLDVHYQPVIDLASGRIVKAEALVRWRHPRLGMIEPAQFIPIAEETGQIKKLGNWVFRQVAASSKRWSSEFGATFPISINKSPMQFMTWDEDGGWIEHLRELGLPGNSLVIEITEGLLLNPSPVVTEKLARYRAAGVELALDDFGTGYSSMAYLKKFDIDYLKIDQSFIGGITDDDEDWAITESIIVMARRLGLTVIAEGIENPRQREMLAAVGCDLGQGYLFSPALPAAEFERMLRAERQPVGRLSATSDAG